MVVGAAVGLAKATTGIAAFTWMASGSDLADTAT